MKKAEDEQKVYIRDNAMNAGSRDGTFEFHVTNMVGLTSVHHTSGVAELRVNLARQVGVLAPCIVLFQQHEDIMIEDSADLAEIFGHGLMRTSYESRKPPLYAMRSVNNLERVKEEVPLWSADKWVNVVEAHVKYGDAKLADHARALIALDDGFEEKMRKWMQRIINTEYAASSSKEYVERVKLAIGLGLDLSVRGMHRYTLLHQAAEHNHVDALHALLGVKDSRGVDVNSRDEYDCTALYRAALKGHVEAVRALIDAGAHPSLANNFNGWTPIIFAAHEGYPDVVSLLLQARADVNERCSAKGDTPLHQAAAEGHVEVVHLLMRAGADVNVKNKKGRKPYASAHKSCKQVLLGRKDCQTNDYGRI